MLGGRIHPLAWRDRDSDSRLTGRRHFSCLCSAIELQSKGENVPWFLTVIFRAIMCSPGSKIPSSFSSLSIQFSIRRSYRGEYF